MPSAISIAHSTPGLHDETGYWIIALGGTKLAANEARERVSKAYVQMDQIDCNADLSRDGKYRQRNKTAAQAIANFEASKTLARARQAVELAAAKHNVEQHVSPEIAEARDASLKAMKEAEQGWRRALDKIAERVSLTKGPDTRR